MRIYDSWARTEVLAQFFCGEICEWMWMWGVVGGVVISFCAKKALRSLHTKGDKEFSDFRMDDAGGVFEGACIG